MSEIEAAEAFDGVQGIGMWMADIVEPTLIVEASGVDDECIAVPLAN